MVKNMGRLSSIVVLVIIFTTAFVASAMEPALEKVLSFGERDVNRITELSLAHEYHFVTSMNCPTSMTIMVDDSEAEGSPFVTVTEDLSGITTAAFVAPALGATHWLPPGGNSYTVWMEQNNPNDDVTYIIEISEDCDRQASVRNAVDARMGQAGNDQIEVISSDSDLDDVINGDDPSLVGDPDTDNDSPGTGDDEFVCIGVIDDVTTQLLSMPTPTSGLVAALMDDLGVHVELATEDGQWVYVVLDDDNPVGAWVDTTEIGLYGECGSLPTVDVGDVLDGSLDNDLEIILSGFIEEITSTTNPLTNSVTDIVGSAAENVTLEVNGIVDTVNSEVSNVVQDTTEDIDAVTGYATEVVDVAANEVSEIVNDVVDEVPVIADDVADNTDDVTEEVVEIIDDVVDEADNIAEDVTDIVDDVTDDDGLVGGLLGGG